MRETCGEGAQVVVCCMMGVTAAQVRVNAVSNETGREGREVACMESSLACAAEPLGNPGT